MPCAAYNPVQTSKTRVAIQWRHTDKRAATPLFRIIRTLAVALAVAAAPLYASASEPTDYATACGQAEILTTQGRHRQAADLLEAIVLTYPQDYALAMQLASLRYEAGQYDEAARHYDRARTLSGGSVASRLGMGWALLRGGDRGAAGNVFTAIVDEHPDQDDARAGLRLAHRPRFDVYPGSALTFHHYAGHPVKQWAIGNAVQLDVRLGESFVVGGVYRYTHFAVRDSQPAAASLQQAQYGATGDTSPAPSWAGPSSSESPSGSTTTPSNPGTGGAPTAAPTAGDLSADLIAADTMQDFAQHEAYAHAGPSFQRWGLTGHYAYLQDRSGTFDNVHAVGLASRLSFWGDLLLEGNISFYDDARIYRAELAWQLPLTSWLSLQPMGSVQQGLGESLFNGALTATVTLGRTISWVGGKFGEELRPAYLSRSIIYNIPDRVVYGGWAGIQVSLGTHGRLYAAYELQRLEQRFDTVEQQSSAHFATVGFAFALSELW